MVVAPLQVLLNPMHALLRSELFACLMIEKSVLELEFTADTSVNPAAKIFAPRLVFGDEYSIKGDGIEFEKSGSQQSLKQSLKLLTQRNETIKIILSG